VQHHYLEFPNKYSGLPEYKFAAATLLWQFVPCCLARCWPQGFLSEVLTMNQSTSPSGLSDAECQEFHTYYIQGYVAWGVGALIAHSLVWIWRPWF
jgi:light-harvesting complex 1 beta chain